MLGESLRESFKNLLRRPTQTALAILGILCGIAGGVLLSSIGDGVDASVQNQVNMIGPGLMTVVSKTQTDPNQQAVPLQMSDVSSLTANDVKGGKVTPVLQTNEPVYGGTHTVLTSVVGVNASFPEMQPLKILSGRFYNEVEDMQARDVVVIGSSLADRLFPGQSALQQDVQIGKTLYRVVGVLQMENNGQTGDANLIMFIPPDTFIQNLQGTENLNAIMVKVNNPTDVPQVEYSIITRLQIVHHWSLPNDAFVVYKQNQILDSAKSLKSMIGLFVTGAILIAFLLGGIGVMNVMLMAASERQREIGIYLSFGARPSFIQLQFLLEAIWISLLGVVGGVLAGLIGGLILQTVGIPWAFRLSVYGEAIGGGIVLGVLFGVYPSLRAARVKPAEVIRK